MIGLSVLATYLAGWVLSLLIFGIGRATGGHLSRYHRYFLGRLSARGKDHRVWMMGIGFLALYATVGLAFAIPSQFFPDVDSDFSRMRISVVPGTTLEQTADVTARIAKRVSKQPEVAQIGRAHV